MKPAQALGAPTHRPHPTSIALTIPRPPTPTPNTTHIHPHTPPPQQPHPTVPSPQEYNLRKMLEHNLKAVVQDGRAISVVEPRHYSRRFLGFLSGVFVS